MAMGCITYSSILGWINHLPPIFDVHQGCRVLTHSHLTQSEDSPVVIGVLFGCFARKVDGPGLPCIIHQGHLFLSYGCGMFFITVVRSETPVAKPTNRKHTKFRSKRTKFGRSKEQAQNLRMFFIVSFPPIGGFEPNRWVLYKGVLYQVDEYSKGWFS